MKVKIVNITFKQYFNLEDRTAYDYALKYGKLPPCDFLGLGSFLERPFGFVKDMQYLATSSTGLTWSGFFEQLEKLLKISFDKLTDKSLFELYQTRLYCVEEIEKINKTESESLGHSPTPEESAAGLERFAEYKAFIQYDALAAGDLTRFEEIEKLPYSLCFTKLKLEADRDQYDRDYTTILKNKNRSE